MAKRDRHDLAGVLLDRAAADEAALRALQDHEEVPDSVLGFHAQQAVEKLLKAVLADRGISYDWSHDIEYLCERLDRHDIKLPPELDRAGLLTPWAAELRYAEPTEPAALERAEALMAVEVARRWATEMIGNKSGGGW